MVTNEILKAYTTGQNRASTLKTPIKNIVFRKVKPKNSKHCRIIAWNLSFKIKPRTRRTFIIIFRKLDKISYYSWFNFEARFQAINLRSFKVFLYPPKNCSDFISFPTIFAKSYKLNFFTKLSTF